MSAQPDPAAVQEMLDEAAIAKLQRRYMFALDWGDGATMAGLFTDDGILSWPEGRVEGREKIAGMFASMPRTGLVRHMVTNSVVDVQGDTARARAYWFDLDKTPDTNSLFVLAYGHYEDELVRTADGWRFTQRMVFNQTPKDSIPPPLNPAW